MTDCNHFWTAWYMVGSKQAERRCNYCDAVERVGEETDDE